jgi:hypothetical protein
VLFQADFMRGGVGVQFILLSLSIFFLLSILFEGVMVSICSILPSVQFGFRFFSLPPPLRPRHSTDTRAGTSTESTRRALCIGTSSRRTCSSMRRGFSR